MTRNERAQIHAERVQATFQLDPQVPITLKGVTYTLEFTNKAVKGVLKDTGFNILASALTMKEMEDPNLLGAMLFHGLQSNHPELTQDGVDGMFTFRHYPYILAQLQQAVNMFLPDMSDVPQDSGEAPAEAPPSDPT